MCVRAAPSTIVVLEVSVQLPLGLFPVLSLIAACIPGWPVQPRLASEAQPDQYSPGSRHLCCWAQPEPAGSLKSLSEP